MFPRLLWPVATSRIAGRARRSASAASRIRRGSGRRATAGLSRPARAGFAEASWPPRGRRGADRPVFSSSSSEATAEDGHGRAASHHLDAAVSQRLV